MFIHHSSGNVSVNPTNLLEIMIHIPYSPYTLSTSNANLFNKLCDEFLKVWKVELNDKGCLIFVKRNEEQETNDSMWSVDPNGFGEGYSRNVENPQGKII